MVPPPTLKKSKAKAKPASKPAKPSKPAKLSKPAQPDKPAKRAPKKKAPKRSSSAHAEPPVVPQDAGGGVPELWECVSVSELAGALTAAATGLSQDSGALHFL